MGGTKNSAGIPPEANSKVFRIAGQITGPIGRFLHIEAASGILLLVTAVIALVWANSPWAEVYEHLLHAPITLGFGDLTWSQSVHFWVNDILMVIFFFVVGLEVRRELYEGELSTPRRAALPVAAALGGMLLPAGIYLALNAGTPAAGGWGVPMATDIAFAVGVLALLGKRVPAALRVLLLALAIIDDIGAILVIAVFYSSGISMAGLALVGVGMALIVFMQRLGVRSPWAYVVPGILVWAGMLNAGVHPTIAGVILGLMTPARSWFGQEGFVRETEEALAAVRDKAASGCDPKDYLPELQRVALAQREALPPVTRIEAALHPWVAYGIMPIFALANAGVSLGGLGDGLAANSGIVLGVSLGLVLGKPLGVLLFSWLAVRLGLASLPRGVTWGGVLVVGCVAGIGFTMALFIGALAFTDPAMLAVAKLSVLIASAVAGVLGLLIGCKALSGGQPADVKGMTANDVERSTSY